MPTNLASACPNHPSIEAVGRCKQCGKPFCSTCETKGPTGRFCSAACKEQHESFVERAKQLDDMRKGTSLGAKAWNLTKKVLVFALAIVILGVIATYFGINVPVISDMVRSVTGG